MGQKLFKIRLAIKADEVLQVRYRGGMLHVLRRPRIDDPEDLPSSIKDTWGWEERNDVTDQDDVRRQK